MAQLRSVEYVEVKLKAWTAAEKKEFTKAYWDGDWDTVFRMTSDLTGSAYFRNRMVIPSLVDEIDEALKKEV